MTTPSSVTLFSATPYTTVVSSSMTVSRLEWEKLASQQQQGNRKPPKPPQPPRRLDNKQPNQNQKIHAESSNSTPNYKKSKPNHQNPGGHRGDNLGLMLAKLVDIVTNWALISAILGPTPE